MKIYPAIDLINGRCVRLLQGDYQAQTEYHQDPLELASDYAAHGAELIHIVDLNAARDGDSSQLGLIADLATALPIPLQTGGGVRDESGLTTRFNIGCRRVAVGSIAAAEPQRFASWLQRYGAERIAAALDVRQNAAGQWYPALHGWEKQSEHDLFTLLDYYSSAGLRHLLCTDISRDGALGGPNTGLYEELTQRYPLLHIQASGGVGQLDDLASLAATGVSAAIIGKALLERRFELPQALTAAKTAVAASI